MFPEKKKTAASFFPISEKPGFQTTPAKYEFSNFEEDMEAAMSAEDYPAALEILDNAPRKLQKEPSFLMTRATILGAKGDESEAIKIFQELETKFPKLIMIYLPMAMFYSDCGYSAHTLIAAKRASSDPELTEDDRVSLAEVMEDATTNIQDQASKINLSFENMQRAFIFFEKAKIAMLDKKLAQVENYSKEANKIAPNWILNLNLRSEALYYSGKTSEAITISEAALELDPINIYTLFNLVFFHTGVLHFESGRKYAARLVELTDNFADESVEMDIIIEALAIVDDTSGLLNVSKRYLDSPTGTLYSRSWQILAVAASRLEKWDEALKILEKADKQELPPTGLTFLDELIITVDENQPFHAWTPVLHPISELYLYPRVMKEFETMLDKSSNNASSQKRKLEVFFQKYPFILYVIHYLLWSESGHVMALDILLQLEKPDLDAEIIRFALSQTGDYLTRFIAIMRLIHAGRYTGSKNVMLWDELLGNWREVELDTQPIGTLPTKAKPATIVLIEKAEKAKNPQDAIALLQKAMVLEPGSPVPGFNLGIMLIQSGKIKEGQSLVLKSVQIDPGFFYGHATIALTEANSNHEEIAQEHLNIIFQAEFIDEDTALVANLARASIALRNFDLDTARQRIDTATLLNPDHPLIQHYEDLFSELLDENELEKDEEITNERDSGELF